MIIRPSPTANGWRLWLAEGATEKELDEGLKYGYIMWHGVRLEIEKVQDWSLGTAELITRQVTIKAPTVDQLKLIDNLAVSLKKQFGSVV